MNDENYSVLFKIGYPIRDNNKRAFWIDGNIHAREWASSHTALYFINQVCVSITETFKGYFKYHSDNQRFKSHISLMFEWPLKVLLQISSYLNTLYFINQICMRIVQTFKDHLISNSKIQRSKASSISFSHSIWF